MAWTKNGIAFFFGLATTMNNGQHDDHLLYMKHTAWSSITKLRLNLSKIIDRLKYGWKRRAQISHAMRFSTKPNRFYLQNATAIWSSSESAKRWSINYHIHILRLIWFLLLHQSLHKLKKLTLVSLQVIDVFWANRCLPKSEHSFEITFLRLFSKVCSRLHEFQLYPYNLLWM